MSVVRDGSRTIGNVAGNTESTLIVREAISAE